MQNVVFQASNMMWVRPGMEAAVLAKHYSFGRIVWVNDQLDYHLQQPLYRALTPRKLFPFTYHEGSFYPIAAVSAFRTFVQGWVAQGNASLEQSLLDVHSYPEETWLYAYVVNMYEPFGRASSNLSCVHTCQVCWRAKTHPFPGIIDEVACGKTTGLFATKVIRDPENNDTKRVAAASSTLALCAANAGAHRAGPNAAKNRTIDVRSSSGAAG